MAASENGGSPKKPSKLKVISWGKQRQTAKPTEPAEVRRIRPPWNPDAPSRAVLAVRAHAPTERWRSGVGRMNSRVHRFHVWEHLTLW